MKIAVITSSPHENGTSFLMVDKFISGAIKAGHEVFRFDAAQKQIHACIGCDTCNKKTDGCIFKDDMMELNPHLLSSQGVVFISPIYYYLINSQLKLVLDRFYANNDRLRQKKFAALILTMADNTLESAEGSIAYFKNFCSYMNWENRGIIASTSSWKRQDIENTSFPLQAYELGLNFEPRK